MAKLVKNNFNVIRVNLFRPKCFSTEKNWNEYFKKFYSGEFSKDFVSAITEALHFAFKYVKVEEVGHEDLKRKLHSTRFFFFVWRLKIDLPVLEVRIRKISLANLQANGRSISFCNLEKKYFGAEIVAREGDVFFLFEILFGINSEILLDGETGNVTRRLFDGQEIMFYIQRS